MPASDTDQSARSPLWGRLALLLGSLLLVFAVGEVAVRIVIENSRVPVEPRDGGPAIPSEPDLPVFKGSLDLSRKNVRGVHKGVLFRSNSQKLRGPEYEAEPAPGVFRIAITGDSVTMGEGVDEEDTYSQQLERLLNALPGEQQYEVLNVGMSGAASRFAMERLSAAVAYYQPKLLIYGFTVNDIEGDHYKEVGERGNELKKAITQGPFARSRSSLIRVMWWKWQALKEPPDPKQEWYSKELHHNFFENPPAWAAFEQDLDGFRALAEDSGACATVLLHAHLSHLDDRHPYTDIYDAVAAAAEARGLKATDTLAGFMGRHPPDLWVGFFDPHPNAEGHAILASQLAEGLARLPRSCWPGGSP